MKIKSKHVYQDRIFSLLPSPAGVRVNFDLKIILGSVNAAIWLSQILYWYDKGEMVNCIRKSRAELEDEIGLTRDQQIRVEDKLKALGVVTIKVLPGRPSQINHITLHINALESLISNVLETRMLGVKAPDTHNSKNYPSNDALPANQYTQNTENISKNTQENTQKLAPPFSLNPNYAHFKEMGDKLKRREDISEYK